MTWGCLGWGCFDMGLLWFGVVLVWGCFGGVVSVGLFWFGVYSYCSLCNDIIINSYKKLETLFLLASQMLL